MSDVLPAVALGALSAASLPLGAATALLWQPADRVLGMLTAFGGGALLAAVTIGIVAPIAEEGLRHLWIYAEEGNESSLRGIAKADFEFHGMIRSSTIIGMTRRSGKVAGVNA